MNNIKLDAQILTDSLISQFEEIFRSVGSFVPFGTFQKSNGSLQSLAASEFSQSEDAVCGILKSTIEEFLKKEEFYSGGYIFKKKDEQVLCLNINSKNSDGWILLQLPFKLIDDSIKYGDFVIG